MSSAALLMAMLNHHLHCNSSSRSQFFIAQQHGQAQAAWPCRGWQHACSRPSQPHQRRAMRKPWSASAAWWRIARPALEAAPRRPPWEMPCEAWAACALIPKQARQLRRCLWLRLSCSSGMPCLTCCKCCFDRFWLSKDFQHGHPRMLSSSFLVAPTRLCRSAATFMLQHLSQSAQHM